MKNIIDFTSKSSMKYILIAIAVLAVAVFVVLPLLPQVDSPAGAISLSAVLAVAEGDFGGGDFGGGDFGGGDFGGEGGGCCSGEGGYGGGGYGGGGGGYTPPHTPPPAPSCLSAISAQVSPDPVFAGESTNVTFTDDFSWGGVNYPVTVSVDGDSKGVQKSAYTIDTSGFAEGNHAVGFSFTQPYDCQPTNPGGYNHVSDAGWCKLASQSCSVNFEVKAPEEDAPVCTLNADPTVLNSSGDSTLTWTTENADSVSIDNGVGSVSEDGSKAVFVSKSTTYTLTATGAGGTVTCDAFVKVKKEQKECKLSIEKSVDKSTAQIGDIIEYTVTFENIGSADCTGGGVRVEDVIDGNLIFVDETHTSNVSAGYSGSLLTNGTLRWNAHTLTPGESGTVVWTGKVKEQNMCGDFSVFNKARITARELNNFKTWVTSNIVETKISNPCVPEAPTCTLDANPTHVPYGGGDSTLTWTTTNADTVTIDNGVGSVGPNDSEVVAVTAAITYTLTATGEGGTVTCEAPITIADPGAPSCVLTVDPNIVDEGGNARVEWDSTNVTHVLIKEIIDGSESTFQDTDAGSGSVVVAPVATTTYRGTFTGPGGIVYCEDSVTVRPQDPLTCTLEADPTAHPFGGGNSTLTWTTENADSVSIDHNIGVVAENDSTVVNVVDDITYTLTATRGNETKQCVAAITVEPQTQGPSCDNFTVTPNSLSAAGDVELAWDTTNVTEVSIDNGVGVVSEDGTTTAAVSTTTTFTLTATKNNITDTCQATVTFEPETPKLSCDLFTADPASLGVGGGDSTLTWETSNATEVSINNGIGTVALDGTQTVTVTTNTTYTLTATDGVDTVSCVAPVTVSTGGGGGGGSSNPRCDLFEASKEIFTPGEEIELHWETRRGRELTIAPIGFETDTNSEVDEGSVTVTPDTNTRYTLTVKRGTRQDTCTLDVSSGGPDITVLSARDQQPITTISFTEIPYTGFDAGPFLTGLFYTLLALWSLGVAYVLVIKRGVVFGISLPSHAGAHNGGVVALPHNEYQMYQRQHEEATGQVKDETPAISESTIAVAPTNLPVGNIGGSYAHEVFTFEENEEEGESENEEVTESEELTSHLENIAHTQNVLLSSDALRMIIDHGNGDSVELLNEVIARAKEMYPREDGWIVINRERISALFRADHDKIPAAKSTAYVPAEISEAGASSLAEAIVTGNTTEAYIALQHEPLVVLADAAEALDTVYRARHDGTIRASANLAIPAERYSDSQLEKAISALTSAIDGVYHDEASAVKLAVIKALKALA